VCVCDARLRDTSPTNKTYNKRPSIQKYRPTIHLLKPSKASIDDHFVSLCTRMPKDTSREPSSSSNSRSSAKIGGPVLPVLKRNQVCVHLELGRRSTSHPQPFRPVISAVSANLWVSRVLIRWTWLCWHPVQEMVLQPPYHTTMWTNLSKFPVMPSALARLACGRTHMQ